MKRLWVIFLIAILFPCSIFAHNATYRKSKPGGRPSDAYDSFYPRFNTIKKRRYFNLRTESNYRPPVLVKEDTPGQGQTFNSIKCSFFGPGLGGWQLPLRADNITAPGYNFKAIGDIDSYFQTKWERRWYHRCWDDYWTSTRHGRYRYKNSKGKWRTGYRYRHEYQHWHAVRDGGYFKTNYSTVYHRRYAYDYSKVYKFNSYGQKQPITRWGNRLYLNWNGELCSTNVYDLKDFKWDFEIRFQYESVYWSPYSDYMSAETKRQSANAKVHPHPVIKTNPYSVRRSTVWSSSKDRNKVNFKLSWQKDPRNKGQEAYYIEYLKFFNGYISMKDVLSMLQNLAPGQQNIEVYMQIGAKPQLYRVYTGGFLYNYFKKKYPSVKAVIVSKEGGKHYLFHLGFDINLDGVVNDEDKTTLETILAKGDLDENSKITINDSTLLANYIKDFESAFDQMALRISAAGKRKVKIGPLYLDNTKKHISILFEGNGKYGTISATAKGTRLFPAYRTSFGWLYTSGLFAINPGYWNDVVMGIIKSKLNLNYGRGNTSGDSALTNLDNNLLKTALKMADIDGDKDFDKYDLAKFDNFRRDKGIILTDIYNKEVKINTSARFKVKTGVVMSVTTPKGASSYTIRDTYSYWFCKPRIWAVDTADGNQLSKSKPFFRPSGQRDPSGDDEVSPPPKPPVQIVNKPVGVNGPGDVLGEDIPYTWNVRYSGNVQIKPGTFQSSWRSTNGKTQNGGSSFKVQFLTAGPHSITYEWSYWKRDIVAVTNQWGIVIDYDAQDTFVQKSRTISFVVEDHVIANYQDPILEISAEGDKAKYATDYIKMEDLLRNRDFPRYVKPYSSVPSVEVKKSELHGDLRNSNWLKQESGSKLTYYDKNFDLIDAGQRYQPNLTLKLKFAKRVADFEDLNSTTNRSLEDVEGYGGINPEKAIKIKIAINRYLENGSSVTVDQFSYPVLFKDLKTYLDRNGEVDISRGQMATYLAKNSRGKYSTIKLLTFKDKFATNLIEPTFPNGSYEVVVTMEYSRRDFVVDDKAGKNASLIAKYSNNSSSAKRDGKLRYFDRQRTSIWNRKVYTVDVQKPTILSFEQTDQNGKWIPVKSNNLLGTTGDQIRYRIRFTDNHDDYGPNDGLKNAGTRRAWYPRFWIQSIKPVNMRLSRTPKEGYELPVILPPVSNILTLKNDGDLAKNVEKEKIERVDGARIAIISPWIEKIGTRNGKTEWELVFQHQFSNYFAGKLRYIFEIEDSSRNYSSISGYFNIIDNKRPNLDIRMASPKYKSIPSPTPIVDIEGIKDVPPPGFKKAIFDSLSWRNRSPNLAVLNMLLKKTDPGLAKVYQHDYSPDMWFKSTKTHQFVSRFNGVRYAYNNGFNLDQNVNFKVTKYNASKSDDPEIVLNSKELKQAFQAVNKPAKGFSEDENIVFDISLRDNVLFIQNDATAKYGKPVPGANLKFVNYQIDEKVNDQNGELYEKHISVTPVKNAGELVPARILGKDKLPLSHIFRAGNANSATGDKNPVNWRIKRKANMGDNKLSVEVRDLAGNSRKLFLDIPIIPSYFNIRVLENDSQIKRTEN